MIVNICDCSSDETLTVYTSGGSKTFKQMSPFKFLPMEVHFNPDSMANILVIKYVDEIPGLHISMYSRKDRAIIVEYNNQIIKFRGCFDGLYYYDASNEFLSHVNYYYFLSTVKYNKDHFSNSEIQGADEVRKSQQELFGQALLTSRTYYQSNFYATIKSQWTISENQNSSMAQ